MLLYCAVVASAGVCCACFFLCSCVCCVLNSKLHCNTGVPLASTCDHTHTHTGSAYRKFDCANIRSGSTAVCAPFMRLCNSRSKRVSAISSLFRVLDYPNVSCRLYFVAINALAGGPLSECVSMLRMIAVCVDSISTLTCVSRLGQSS